MEEMEKTEEEDVRPSDINHKSVYVYDLSFKIFTTICPLVQI